MKALILDWDLKLFFEAIYLNGEIILDSQDGSHLICESLRGEHRFKSCRKIQAVGRETRDHNPRTNMSMVVRSKEHVRKKKREHVESSAVKKALCPC